VAVAADGEEALSKKQGLLPDLILLDILMPKLDGIAVTRRLKADTSLPFIPIILLTAKSESKDVAAGLEAGGADYITKPIDHASLVARVRSMLRIKALHDKIQEQAAELSSWNKTLEARVADQLGEIERIGRLKRFVAPQIAELIVSSAMRASSTATVATSPCCSAICGGSQPLPRPVSRKSSWRYCATTMERWARSSTASRGRSIASPATGS